MVYFPSPYRHRSSLSLPPCLCSALTSPLRDCLPLFSFVFFSTAFDFPSFLPSSHFYDAGCDELDLMNAGNTPKSQCTGFGAPEKDLEEVERLPIHADAASRMGTGFADHKIELRPVARCGLHRFGRRHTPWCAEQAHCTAACVEADLRRLSSLAVVGASGVMSVRCCVG